VDRIIRDAKMDKHGKTNQARINSFFSIDSILMLVRGGMAILSAKYENVWAIACQILAMNSCGTC
jgi:hypothetical protein